MIWLALKLNDLVNRAEEWFWGAWYWLKFTIHPDKRPSAEILAEVRAKLEQMPAAKEIHEAHALISKALGEPGRALAEERRGQ